MSSRCGTRRGLVRIAPVRIVAGLLIAAVVASSACGGGPPAQPSFTPTNVSVSDDAGSPIADDASIEEIQAAFARCAATPATGSLPCLLYTSDAADE